MCVLETEPRFSAKAISALDCQANSQALDFFFLINKNTSPFFIATWNSIKWLYSYFLKQSIQTEHLNYYDIFVAWIWQVGNRLSFSAFYFLPSYVCGLVCASAQKALSKSTAVHSRPDGQINTFCLLLQRPESCLSRLWYKLTVEPGKCFPKVWVRQSPVLRDPWILWQLLASSVME